MDEPAAERLTAFLEPPAGGPRRALPHRRRLLIESCSGEPPPGEDLPPGLPAHPLGAAGQRAAGPGCWPPLWAGTTGRPLEVFVDDALPRCCSCRPTRSPPERRMRRTCCAAAASAALERLLRRRLEGSGFFGARFRENAGRALLLPRSDFRRRVPLWLTRLRSKRLLEAVSRYPDFPMLDGDLAHLPAGRVRPARAARPARRGAGRGDPAGAGAHRPTLPVRRGAGLEPGQPAPVRRGRGGGRPALRAQAGPHPPGGALRGAAPRPGSADRGGIPGPAAAPRARLGAPRRRRPAGLGAGAALRPRRGMGGAAGGDGAGHGRRGCDGCGGRRRGGGRRRDPRRQPRAGRPAGPAAPAGHRRRGRRGGGGRRPRPAAPPAPGAGRRRVGGPRRHRPCRARRRPARRAA